MTGWLQVISLLLQLAAFIARRAERYDIEKAVLNDLKLLQADRVDAAAAARDDVLSDRVQPDDNDPYRRD